jgi:branched-chain amino acid aminotransferase
VSRLETDFTLAEVYNAEEAFVSGTFGGVTPVSAVDGRPMGPRVPGPVTTRLSELYDNAFLKAGPP